MRRRWARRLSLLLAFFMLTGSVAYGMGLPGEVPETGGLKLEEETLPETEPLPATDAEEGSADETGREPLPADPSEADLSSGPEEPGETSWAEGSAEEILQLELDHYESAQNRPLASNAASRSVQNVIVFLRFQDTGEYITGQKVANAEKTFNEDENSLKKYMDRISYGRYQVSTAFFPQNGDGSYYSVEISHPSDYFKRQYTKEDGTVSEGYTSGTQRSDRELELVTEAMQAVCAQLEASGLSLDTDGDGIIDSISFVIPVYGMGGIENIEHGDLLWPHKIDSWIEVPVNGLHVRTYTMLNRGSENIGIFGAVKRSSQTMIHEYLHSLGLPDLYRVGDLNAKPVGPWDIMEGGGSEPPNLSAYYQREVLGYGTSLSVLTETKKNITLPAAQYADPSESYAVIVRSPRRNDASFVIENRPVDSGNEDQKNSGLLIYRINESGNGPSAWDGNAAGPPDFIYVFRPGESDFNAADGEIGYATLSEDNAKGFTSLGKALGTENQGYDNGILYFADGANSGIIVDQIRKNGDGSITFDLTVPEALSGKGTESEPYEIRTAGDLAAIGAARSGEWYRLMNDLDLSGQDFPVISRFQGILDGNGKTIRNLTVNGEFGAGLVDQLAAGGVLRDLVFVNPEIHAGNGYAGIVAESYGELSGIVVEGGTISSGSRAGGLVGYLLNQGSIQGCRTSADVTAAEAGGLCSYVQEAEIRDSFASGKVSGLSETSVLGGVFSNLVDVSDHKMVFSQVYWDLDATGQALSGREWTASSGKIFPGTTGIRIKATALEQTGDSGFASVEKTGDLPIPAGVWESTDSGVLSADPSSGAIKAQGAGTAALCYTFSLGTVKCSVKQDFSITHSHIPLTGITLNKSSLSLTEGDQATLTVSYQPENTTDSRTVSWSSSNPSVAAVSNGTVTARNAGTAVITAKVSEKTASCTVTVRKKSVPLSGIALDKSSLSLTEGDQATLTVSYQPENTTDSRTVSWSSSNPSVAAVSNGTVTARNAGTAVITAKTQSKSAACRVEVKAPDPVGDFVTRLYELVLGRTPDKNGWLSWKNLLLTRQQSGTGVAFGFIFSQEYQRKNTADADYVEMLYQTILGRSSDASGKAFWLERISQGMSRYGIFAGFSNSREFREICGRYGIDAGTYTSPEAVDQRPEVTAFVSRMYTVCLGRRFDKTGLYDWTSRLIAQEMGGGELAKGFFFSREFVEKGHSDQTYVTLLYRTMLNREPDSAGLRDWCSRLASGSSREFVFDGFLYSREFTKLCQDYGIER